MASAGGLIRVLFRSGGASPATAATGATGFATGTSSPIWDSPTGRFGGRNSNPAGKVRLIVLTRGQWGRHWKFAASATPTGRLTQCTFGSRFRAPFNPEAKISTSRSQAVSVGGTLSSGPGIPASFAMVGVGSEASFIAALRFSEFPAVPRGRARRVLADRRRPESAALCRKWPRDRHRGQDESVRSGAPA